MTTPSCNLAQAVETVILGALEHLGERVVLPVTRGHAELEVAACVRILGCGEPGREFTNGDELKVREPPLPEGTLILYFLARSPYAYGSAAAALYIQALSCVWPDFEPGVGMTLPGGYRGWIGPLPEGWITRIAA